MQRFQTLNNHFLSRQDMNCTTNTRVYPCVVFCPRFFSNNEALKRGKKKRGQNLSERDADTQITEEPLRRGSVPQSIKLIYLSCCHHLLLSEDYGCHDVEYLENEEIGKQFKLLCKSNLTNTRTSLNIKVL